MALPRGAVGCPRLSRDGEKGRQGGPWEHVGNTEKSVDMSKKIRMSSKGHLWSVLLLPAVVCGCILPLFAADIGECLFAVGEVNTDGIRVDGTRDSGYTETASFALDTHTEGVDTGTCARGAMAWSEDCLFLFVAVSDETPGAGDAVTLYLDAGNRGTGDTECFTVFSDGSTVYRRRQNGTALYGRDADPYFDGCVARKTETGYTVEATFRPGSCKPAPGEAIGLYIEVRDAALAEDTDASIAGPPITEEGAPSPVSVYGLSSSLGARGWEAGLYDYVVLAKATQAAPPHQGDPGLTEDVSTPNDGLGLIAAGAAAAVALGIALLRKKD